MLRLCWLNRFGEFGRLYRLGCLRMCCLWRLGSHRGLGCPHRLTFVHRLSFLHRLSWLHRLGWLHRLRCRYRTPRGQRHRPR